MMNVDKEKSESGDQNVKIFKAIGYNYIMNKDKH